MDGSYHSTYFQFRQNVVFGHIHCPRTHKLFMNDRVSNSLGKKKRPDHSPFFYIPLLNRNLGHQESID